MTATITLAHRHGGPFTVNDPATVEDITEGVAAYNRHEGDRQFRIRRTARQWVVFHASQVEAVNADGIDLTDLGNPFGMAEAVAA